MELIDKAAVVAEIERRITLYKSEKSKENASKVDKISLGARIAMLEEMISFLNTLEVKEVDLDKSLTGFMSRYAYENGGEYPSAIDVAKHFFGLGLKTQKGE